MVLLLTLDGIDRAVFVCSLLMQTMMQDGRAGVRRRPVIFHPGDVIDIREPDALLNLLKTGPVFDQAVFSKIRPFFDGVRHGLLHRQFGGRGRFDQNFFTEMRVYA